MDEEEEEMEETEIKEEIEETEIKAWEDTVITARLLKGMGYVLTSLFSLHVGNRMITHEFLSFCAPGLRENLLLRRIF